MKDKKLVLTGSSTVLLGLTAYLHSIDHSTWVQLPPPPICSNPLVSCAPTGYYAPPPWYANLWPETLVIGLGLLLITWYKELYYGIKTLYKKWYDYEFGWQEEELSPFKIHRPDEEE
ncbi:hypothetical protein [Sulfurisphaera ohwakuensis]|uniref:Uncharacterized protein n=1 Tax=Sulfurisphaera ohwakuensis TaxID=69656 RepID=A0A7J9RT41_SULOH|nr:hypothetical protein [Sulfurisphaera ohwakuensis]MBB5253209.1 hypothetical protein [Sulfurisphaera ohwakuensis]